MPKTNNNAFRPTFSLNLPAGESTRDESRDELLGVLTRPVFLERLAEAKRDADEARSTFSLCLVDVDHLRNINDGHGPRAGDAVLIGIAQRLERLLAAEPWSAHPHAVGRFDGDALIVLGQGCDLRQATAMAEALRSSVAAAPLVGPIGATVSVGTAQYRIDECLDETLARLERAVHLAKQFGRDRVEAHPSPGLAKRSAVLAFAPGAARKPPG